MFLLPLSTRREFVVPCLVLRQPAYNSFVFVHEAAWDMQNVGGLDTKGLLEQKDSLLIPQAIGQRTLSCGHAD
jgi:hypothetical protein